MKFILLLFYFFNIHAATPIKIIEKFDHDLHSTKVLKELDVKCSFCHNVDIVGNKASANVEIRTSALRMSVKDLCHECHRTSDVKYLAAPKTCYTCHRSIENLEAIKPQNHNNISWKTSHSMEGRILGDYCINCHTSSYCVKCHLRRNDIEMKNHSRNFRFVHSVQARLQPHKCDTCHSKTFCIQCHQGNR